MADILTRREARQQAMQNRGYNRGQFQFAMANAKNALRRNSDLRGRDLRQAARRMVAGAPSNEELTTETLPASNPSENRFAYFDSLKNTNAANTIGNMIWNVGNNQTTFTPFSRDSSRFTDQNLLYYTPKANESTTQPLATRSEATTTTPVQSSTATPTTPQYKDGDDFTSMGKFGNAFAAASKAGLKTFMWNGKSYGTRKDPNWRERWGLDTKTPVANGGELAPATGVAARKTPSEKVEVTGKVDNWNIKDVLPENIYNDLETSIQSAIDSEIDAQQNADIQNIIAPDIDFGPTMRRPNVMVHMSNPKDGRKPGWHATSESTSAWSRGFKNGKIGDFTWLDGKRYFNPFPEDLQKVYAGATVNVDPKTGFSNTVPVVTANPKTDPDLYRKQAMARWSYILTHQSEFSPRESQYARENLPVYQKRYGNQ